jgi:hypothetical protein
MARVANGEIPTTNEKRGGGGRQRAYGLVDLLAEVGLPSVAVLVLRGSLPLRHL